MCAGFREVVRAYNLTLVVREPETPEEHRELMEVERLIWSPDYREVFPYHITIPLLDIGGVVLGVYDANSGKPVGVIIMMPGFRNGKPFLYSHMFGLVKEYRGKGVGSKLKEIQRKIALMKGYDLVEWTYDPLLSVNAWFNFVKSGVIARKYKPNYYGFVDFEYNRGIESDRLLAEWHLKSRRVEERMAGKGRHEPAEYFLDRGAEIALTTELLSNGFRAPREPRLWLNEELIVIEVPKNFVDMQVREPRLAREWRLRAREVLVHYLSRGYVVFEFTRSGRERDRFYYVLWKVDPARILRGDYP